MIRPLNGYVLLEIEPTEKKVGSIILTNDQKKTNVAKVVAVGKGKLVNGTIEPINVKVNEKVIYRGYSTVEYEDNDKKYLLVPSEDIIAVVE